MKNIKKVTRIFISIILFFFDHLSAFACTKVLVLFRSSECRRHGPVARSRVFREGEGCWTRILPGVDQCKQTILSLSRIAESAKVDRVNGFIC